MFEDEFVAWICSHPHPNERVRIGPGDDAALVQTRGLQLVTTDTLCDQVHFDLVRDGAGRVGRKALAVSLSDIAAMGGQPEFAVVQMVLPRSMSMGTARQLARGIFSLAEQHGVVIVGGDTNRWDGGLVIGTTVTGSPIGDVWPLGGATAGDRIVVSGAFGGSLAGHHLDFDPRCGLARWLAENFRIHAATDVSDSLSIDLANMAQASRVAAEFDPRRIPLRPVIEKLPFDAAIEHALTDGEDFELILAVPPDVAGEICGHPDSPCPLTDIGFFREGESGLFQRVEGGGVVPVRASGYVHV